MQGLFVGAKVIKSGDNDPICLVELVPSGAEGPEHRSGTSKKSGKEYDVRSVGGAQTIPAALELFPKLQKLEVGAQFGFDMQPDPANLSRARIGSLK